MTKIANSPLEKRNKEHNENLKVAKTWIKSLMDKIEFETTPVKTRWERKNSGALVLNMDGIEHEHEKMGWYLMKSTTHCLQNYWKNGTMGKKDFR